MVIKVKYNGEWVKIPYLSTGGDSGTGFVEEAPKNGQQYTRKDGAWTVLNIPDDITETINNKVDKVEGKELSSNDFTDAYKAKLDGIAENANNYVHPTTPGNKHIPAGGSSGQILRWESDGTAVWGNDNNTVYTEATVTASGLMSATDKVKLDGIAAGAEVNVNADWNATEGDALILNKPNLVGMDNLPTWVFDASALYTEEGDDYITVHGNKKNLQTGETTNIGSTIHVATSEHIGYMSPSDKTTLDELAANAITSTEVDQKINNAIASVYRVKGTVANFEALPTTDVVVGDVYNLEDTGANYVATSTTPTWDKLSETVDLSAYSTTVQNDAKYQPKGNYLTSIPSEYVTDTELNSKGYLTDATSDGKLYGRKDGVWSEVQGDNVYYIDYLYNHNGVLVESITDEQYNELKEHIINGSSIQIKTFETGDPSANAFVKMYATNTSAVYYVGVIQLTYNPAPTTGVENTVLTSIVISEESPHIVQLESQLNLEELILTKPKVEEVLTGNIKSHSHDITYVEVEDTYGTDTWDGTTISTGLSGSGTENDPYLIQSCADWLYLYTNGLVDTVGADVWPMIQFPLNIQPNTYIRLTKNLNFNNKTIPNPYNVFDLLLHPAFVDFDGNNLTISNFKMPNILQLSNKFTGGVFPTCVFSYVHNFNLKDIQIVVDNTTISAVGIAEVFMVSSISTSYCYCFNNYIDFTLTIEGEITKESHLQVVCGCGFNVDIMFTNYNTLTNNYYRSKYKDVYSGISATIQDNTTKSNGVILTVNVVDAVSNCKTSYYDIPSNAISYSIDESVVFPEDSTFNYVFGLQTFSENIPKVYFNTDKSTTCAATSVDLAGNQMLIDTIGKTETELKSSTFVNELNSNLSVSAFKYNVSDLPTLGTFEIDYNGYVKYDEFNNTVNSLNNAINVSLNADCFSIVHDVYKLETTDSAEEIADAFVTYDYLKLISDAISSNKKIYINGDGGGFSVPVNYIKYLSGSEGNNKYGKLTLQFNYNDSSNECSSIKYIQCVIYENQTSTGTNYKESDTWIKQYYLGGYDLPKTILNLSSSSSSSTISNVVGGVNGFKKLIKVASDGNMFTIKTIDVNDSYLCTNLIPIFGKMINDEGILMLKTTIYNKSVFAFADVAITLQYSAGNFTCQLRSSPAYAET